MDERGCAAPYADAAVNGLPEVKTAENTKIECAPDCKLQTSDFKEAMENSDKAAESVSPDFKPADYKSPDSNSPVSNAPMSKAPVSKEPASEAAVPKEPDSNGPAAKAAVSEQSNGPVAKAAVSKEPKAAVSEQHNGPVAKAAVSEQHNGPVAKAAVSEQPNGPVAKAAVSEQPNGPVAKAPASKEPKAAVSEQPNAPIAKAAVSKDPKAAVSKQSNGPVAKAAVSKHPKAAVAKRSDSKASGGVDAKGLPEKVSSLPNTCKETRDLRGSNETLSCTSASAPKLRDARKQQFSLMKIWNAIGGKKKEGQNLKRALGGGSKANIDAVFNELKSSAVETHEQQDSEFIRPSFVALHSQLIPAEPAATPVQSGIRRVMSKRMSKVGRLELEREREWIVEHYKDHKGVLKIEGAMINQNLQVRECDGVTVQVVSKINNVIIESCKKTNVVLTGVISSIELVHCDKIQLQVLGSCPSVNLDNCSSFTMFVGKEGMDVFITTSRSCDMNINYPSLDDPDDWTETPIPQQFCHVLNKKGKVESRVSDLYG